MRNGASRKVLKVVLPNDESGMFRDHPHPRHPRVTIRIYEVNFPGNGRRLRVALEIVLFSALILATRCANYQDVFGPGALPGRGDRSPCSSMRSAPFSSMGRRWAVRITSRS